MSKYVKVDDLQAFCDNQIDHTITPNVFQRMNHIEIPDDIYTLLKEQEARIEQLKRFVNGFSRDAMPVVRCKDCKHRPIMPKDHTDGFDLKFPDNKCPCQCEDGWYSWYPEDNWFCAYGERKE